MLAFDQPKETGCENHKYRKFLVQLIKFIKLVKLIIGELDKLYLKDESSLTHEAYETLEKF